MSIKAKALPRAEWIDESSAVDWLYYALLGRAPDATEAQAGAALFAQDGRNGLLRQLLLSSAFSEEVGEDFFWSLAAARRIPGFARLLAHFPPDLTKRPPSDSWSDWLGTVSRCAIWDKWRGREGRNMAFRSLQAYEVEWTALLEATLMAGPKATFMELGAGWGPWLVRAHAGMGRLKPPGQAQLIAVEADPDYHEILRAHFCANGIDPERHQIIPAAVAPKAGTVSFEAAARKEDTWGLAVASWSSGEAGRRPLPAVSLEELLGKAPSFDLIHCDIQGREIEVLSACPPALFDSKVKRLMLGTHGRAIEEAAMKLLGSRGWILRAEMPCQFKLRPKGARLWRDGAQYWVNPALTDPEPPL